MTKRTILLLLAAVLLLGSLAGCQKKPVTIDGEELYAKMAALGQFPEMARRTGDMIYDYYGIDPEQCSQLVNYASADGLMTDEFMLAQAKEEAYAQEIEAMLREQVAHQAETYREYMPQEYPKISGARIERNGCYVLLIVAEDVDKLYALYTAALK